MADLHSLEADYPTLLLLKEGKAKFSNREIEVNELVSEILGNEPLVRAFLYRLITGQPGIQEELQKTAMNLALDIDARVIN